MFAGDGVGRSARCTAWAMDGRRPNQVDTANEITQRRCDLVERNHREARKKWVDFIVSG
jgi:hypothetical protein